MTKKIELGSLLSAVGATLLLISLFLNWFEPGITAWQAFEIIDLLLAAISVAVLIVAAGDLGAVDFDGGRFSPPLAAAAVILVVSQLVNHPPGVLTARLMTGAWLALAGAVVIMVGALMTASRVSFAVNVAKRSSSEGGEGTASSTTSTEAKTSAPTEPMSSGQVQQAESDVAGELYPDAERRGPIGSDDPEPWRSHRQSPGEGHTRE